MKRPLGALADAIAAAIESATRELVARGMDEETARITATCRAELDREAIRVTVDRKAQEAK